MIRNLGGYYYIKPRGEKALFEATGADFFSIYTYVDLLSRIADTYFKIKGLNFSDDAEAPKRYCRYLDDIHEIIKSIYGDYVAVGDIDDKIKELKTSIGRELFLNMGVIKKEGLNKIRAEFKYLDGPNWGTQGCFCFVEDIKYHDLTVSVQPSSIMAFLREGAAAPDKVDSILEYFAQRTQMENLIFTESREVDLDWNWGVGRSNDKNDPHKKWIDSLRLTKNFHQLVHDIVDEVNAGKLNVGTDLDNKIDVLNSYLAYALTGSLIYIALEVNEMSSDVEVVEAVRCRMETIKNLGKEE